VDDLWCRPPEDLLKINVDAACNEDEGRENCGIVIMDSSGKFIADTCMDLPYVDDPMMAEAYALREGLCMAQHIGCNKFIIQLDNSQVIETMQGGFFLLLH
jgi:ribonuclease HI